MKSKLTYLLIGATIVTAVFLGFKLKNEPIIKAPVISKNEIEQYYVPVTNYFSPRSEIKLADLEKEKVWVEKGQLSKIKKIIPKIDAEEKTDEELQNLSGNQLAIIKWSTVTVRQKSLMVNGKYLWNKDDVKDYSLQIKVEGKKEDKFDSSKLTKITAVGDVMLSRHVNTKIQKYGTGHPWEKMTAKISDADITFANLEVPLSDRFSAPNQGMSFIAPTSNIPAIKSAGVDIVSVANNHTANFGWQVFEDNLTNLNTGGINTCGGGLNDKEARTPKIFEKNGTRFAFLCYSSIIGTPFSGAETSGAPEVKIEPWYRDDQADINRMVSDIKKAKQEADVVIVSPHWGVEYKVNPNESQQKTAKAAIEAGADLILGTHPHVVQGSEIINGKYSTYSLGNFIFDQEWSIETKQGTILENYFYGKKQVAASLTPVQIEDYHQPNYLSQKNGQLIIDRIKQASVGF